MSDEITDRKKATIIALYGLGYSQAEVGRFTWTGKSTAAKYIQQANAEAERSDDPLQVWVKWIDPLITVRVEVADV